MTKPSFILIVIAFIVLSVITANAVPTRGHQVLFAGPSQHGVEVTRLISGKGGNVVDVAVAVGLTLSVTSPYFASLGGGGFALIKMQDQPVQAVDFREVAPAATSEDFYVKSSEKASVLGGSAVGVPGFPAGLYEMHKKYGRLPWKSLFSYPLKLAKEGFWVTGDWVNDTNKALPTFNDAGKKYLQKNNKTPFLPGELLKQPQVAKALELFRDQGPKGFYSGAVATDIVSTVKNTGGVISAKDLTDYKVRWLKPLEHDFNGYHFYLMPPPSSGGLVIKTALSLAEKLNLPKEETLSVNELHLLGETLSRSFRGRSQLGDPDFHRNPVEALTSSKYIDELANSIKRNKATQIKPLAEDFSGEHAETTHYSVLDKDGNAVSLTVTLNGTYGSGVVTEKFGIALNNEMDDFTTRPNEPNMYGLLQGKGNVVQPGKRPLSSMSPTLVEKNKKVILAIGAPGGPRIISGVFQVLYRTLVSGMDLDSAIQAPRLHHQFLPNKLYVEKWRFQPATLDGLKDKGHDLEASWNSKVCGVQLLEDGTLAASFDSRSEGAAGGF